MGAIKSVLLTGGTGFVGSHILEALINSGYDVVLLKRSQSNTWRIDQLNNKYLAYNLDDPAVTINSVFEKHHIDAIIHTATEYGKNEPYYKVLQTNVIFPVQLIETCLQYGLKLFINTDTFFTKSDKYDYLSQYSSSKAIAKQILESFKEKVKIVNMQLEHVFGEKDADGKFVNHIISKLISNESQIELTDGLQKRDFVYVKDVANAYITILEHFTDLMSYSSFEVGTGVPVSIRTFVEKAANLSKSNSKLIFGAIPKRAGEFEQSFANDNLTQQLRWTAATTLDEALSRTIEYYKLRKF